MGDKNLFKKPMTVFQQNVNAIIKDNPVNDLVKDLIKLNMLKNSEKDDKQLVLVELYNLLGTEKFMEVIELLSGKTIRFPTKSDFKETIQIALCYYLRQYKDLSWDQIKDIIQDDELSSVKLGVRVQQLQRFIEHHNENRIKKEILENGRRVD
jgi:hypothetical protein